MYKYVVENNSKLSQTTNLLTLRHIKKGSPLLFQPGQYAAIGFKSNFRPTSVRCFSIASSPTDQDKLQFSFRIKGKYTSALRNVKAGDEVFVRGPYGGFVMDSHYDNDVVFFAGGIGIAPFMGMIEYVTTLQLKNNIHLVYSCQTQEDIPFLEKLKDLTAKTANLTVTYIMSDENVNLLAGQRVAVGRVDSQMLDRLNLNFESQKFFICGPPPYMKALTGLLTGRGVASDMIITEAFGQGSNRQSGAIRSWPFNIYALTTLGIIIGGFVIMSMDLAKTIPKLENTGVITPSGTTDIIKTNGKNQKSAINSVGPLVDTNLKQPVIIKTPTVTQSTPTTQQPTTTTPVATIKPVVKPVPKPKSTVS
jgi:ferredoxin-NADP reductase